MKLYVVRNLEGKFFRSIGYQGFGKSWVDELAKAKFYAKRGQAEGRVTYFYKHHPKFGCPEILEFDVTVENAVVLNMKEATDKKLAKKKAAELKQKAKYVEWQKEQLELKRKDLERQLKNLK